MKKINTWLKLYSKLCRQPLKFIQNRKIVYKDGDRVWDKCIGSACRHRTWNLQGLLPSRAGGRH